VFWKVGKERKKISRKDAKAQRKEKAMSNEQQKKAMSNEQ